jgi:hypothetical protein
MTPRIVIGLQVALIVACSPAPAPAMPSGTQPQTTPNPVTVSVLAGSAGPATTAASGAGARAMGGAGVPGTGGQAGMLLGAAGATAGGSRPPLTAAGSGGRAGSAGGLAAAGADAANDGSMLGVDASAGWLLTVYHTPVESFHTQPAIMVVGCAAMPCANGKDALGAFASDFVQSVKDNGAGRITSGSSAGKYLNWSIDIGYWLDEAPRDARGQALVPWVSAAADPKVAYGTRFSVVDCGADQAQGTPVDPTVCMALKQGKWVVSDRFTVGAVGAQFDLYIGEEDHTNYDATSPYLITVAHARIALAN